MVVVRVAALVLLFVAAGWANGLFRVGQTTDVPSSTLISGKKVVLREADDKQAVTLRSGDTLTVELEGRPGTGYAWQVIGSLPPGLRDDGVTDADPPASGNEPSSSGQVGTARLQNFHFTAAGKGRGTLALGYRRAWEKSVDPLRRFEVDIAIE